MGLWIWLLIVDLLIPLTELGFGTLFLRRAPKNINFIFGYRTALSMKNRDTWSFAHRMIGRLWLTLGGVLLPLSPVPLLFCLRSDERAIALTGGIVAVVQILLLILSVIPVEIALHRTFDENGIRKS